MKKNYSALISFLCLFLLSASIFANGTGSSTQKSTTTATTAKAQIYQGPEYTITVNLIQGSLKANIERIAKENGWEKVAWNAPSDYNWTANTKIKDQSLVAVMKVILADYPLQAVFYQGNRVLVIQTRTVR